MQPLWPHQVAGIAEFHERRKNGFRRIILTSPTGMGKTRIALQLILDELEYGGNVLIYTGRRVLLDQLQRDLSSIPFGVRAAGVLADAKKRVQIASIHTDKSRSKREGFQDFAATLVILEEAHMHTSARDLAVIDRHVQRGATVCLLTATPVDMEGAADIIVQAGTNSQGRKCGALIRARHYGPDEPAMSARRRTLTGLLGASEEEIRTAMGRVTDGQPDRKATALFGRVLEYFDKLNKQRKPTILFASGVPESIWFHDEFMRHGITAAHVDGDRVIVNGSELDCSSVEKKTQARDEVARLSEAGEVTIICNRFVLREGVNYPWLAHGIFATVFDSLQAYLQAGGRLLRAHPSLKTVCIQDHGGNWLRHGSLNSDRIWRLGATSGMYAGVYEELLREADGDPDARPEQREPVRCPMCSAICLGGKCTECEFDFQGLPRHREVLQSNGTLVRITGKMFPALTVVKEADTEAKWCQIFWRMRNAPKPKTFNQAYAYFFHCHGYRPPRTLAYMPVDPYDWHRHIKAVAFGRLRPGPEKKPGDRRVRRKPKKDEKGLFDDEQPE